MRLLASREGRKRYTALQAIEDRLRAIEAAMRDLSAADIRSVDAATFDTDHVLRERYANRIGAVAFHLTHLLDDAKTLATRAGVDVAVLDRIVHSSLPLRVVINLTNSAQDGVGGHKKSVTVLNGFLISPQHRRGVSEVDPQAPVVSMKIVDAKEGTFASKTILHSAIHHWAQILHSAFGIKPGWADRASGAMSAGFGIGGLAKLAPATPVASRRARRYRRVGPFYPRWGTDRLYVIAAQLVLAGLLIVVLIWSLLMHGRPSTRTPGRMPASSQPRPTRSR